MKLKHLISNIRYQIVSSNDLGMLWDDSGLVDIKGLALNSKLVKQGALFFCLPGTCHKGSEYISEAYGNGARVIMADKKIPSFSKKILLIEAKDTKKCLGIIAEKFYGHPLKKVKTIAVTGTNGKTSTTFIIESILNNYKKKVGVIGTVNYRFGREIIDPKNTTPDILTTYHLINRMLKQNTEHILIEVSSHALDQRRVEGLKFDQAIFTNLSQDHLDYHMTKKNYFKAKAKLFTDHLKRNATAVINMDDSYGASLKKLIRNKNKFLTYAIKKKASLKAKDIVLGDQVSSFTVQCKRHEFRVDTNLIGLFNIYNCLAAIGSCLTMGVPKKYIISGLRNVYVPGRLELVSCNNNVRIFVDYAHTEDALRNVLVTLNKLKNSGRLIVVFGCGGNRDKDKRHKMGKAANELADFVIITSDNPRFEDPKKIISDVRKGLHNKNNLAIIDRRRAIEKAIAIAERQDIILVAGKGHENYQIIKDKKIAFNDRVVIKSILSKTGAIG